MTAREQGILDNIIIEAEQRQALRPKYPKYYMLNVLTSLGEQMNFDNKILPKLDWQDDVIEWQEVSEQKFIEYLHNWNGEALSSGREERWMSCYILYIFTEQSLRLIAKRDIDGKFLISNL